MTQIKVSVSALDGWSDALRAHGMEGTLVDSLVSATASPGESPEVIPLKSFVRFSENVVASSRNVALPWLVGLNYDLASLGCLGGFIGSATQVGTALHRLVEYFSLLQDCTELRLERDENTAMLSYRILDPDIWPRHHDAMFSLGILAQILRKGVHNGWDNVEFHFEADQGSICGDIGKVVDAPCRFSAESNMMRFPAAFLDCDIEPTFADATRRQVNDALVARRRAMPVVERLAEIVYRDLDRLTIDQDRIAREIGMSSRTLRRRLDREGSSFQQVLDECRMRQAVFEFRTKPKVSIAEIALALGYSEHSTFTRAFHRWAGMSPHQFRARIDSKVN